LGTNEIGEARLGTASGSASPFRGDAKFDLTEHPVYGAVRAQPVTSWPREINVS